MYRVSTRSVFRLHKDRRPPCLRPVQLGGRLFRPDSPGVRTPISGVSQAYSLTRQRSQRWRWASIGAVALIGNEFLAGSAATALLGNGHPRARDSDAPAPGGPADHDGANRRVTQGTAVRRPGARPRAPADDSSTRAAAARRLALTVVVARTRPGLVGREQPGVEQRRVDHGDAVRLARRQHVGERGLLEQRVASRDHDEVESPRAPHAQRHPRPSSRCRSHRRRPPRGVAPAREALGEPAIQVVASGSCR